MVKATTSPVGTEFNVSTYNEHGYFILKAGLSAADTTELKNFIEPFNEKIKGLEGDEKRKSVVDGQCVIDCQLISNGRYAIRKVHNDIIEYPRMLELYTTANVIAVVKEIIGDEIYIHHTKYMCKPAMGGIGKPWHQDLAYWEEKKSVALRMVTVWTALEPSTRENGCIQIIPGSHKELLPHHHGEDFMIDETLIAHKEIVYAEMAPGDALFMDVKLMHASAANDSLKSRQSTIISFSSQVSSESSQSPVFRYNFADKQRLKKSTGQN